MKNGFLGILCGFMWGILCFNPLESKAQGEQQVIIFSGLLVEGDSAYGIPNAHIYIPKVGRGTVSDSWGSFRMPVLAGDTVEISVIGYQTQRVVIPNTKSKSYSVLINMKEEMVYMPEVVVFPYASPEEFKEAVLAVELPNDQSEILRKSLNSNKIRAMASSLPMSANMSHRYFMKQQIGAIANRNSATAIPLLNPFAWYEFIKSLKKKKKKKKKSYSDDY